MELSAVAQQCPDDVYQAACQGDQDLGVELSLSSFALVEGAGWAVLDLDGRQRGEVEDAAQAAVVALGAVQVAAGAAGVAGDGGESGVGGKSAGIAERRAQVAAG